MSTEPPAISPSEAPRDAVGVALAWLAEAVEDVAAVRSKQVLRRTRGTVQLEVRFQSSTYSRREIGAWASLSVQVCDPAFGRWRAEHPELTWRTGSLVHSSGTLSPSVALYGDGAGHRHLAELPDLLRRDLLPVLDMFDTPARLASEYDVRRPRGTAIRNDLDWWGPTLETLGILAPGEPLPGTPRPVRPGVDEKSRLRAILGELGRVTEVGAD